MNDEHTEYVSRCMCGNVRFEVTGEPLWVGFCHCDSCRRATGGILVAAAGFALVDVSFDQSRVSTYASSPGVRRYFCACCGTSLAYRSDRWPDDMHLFLGAFEQPDRLPPQFHIFADDSLSWLRLADGLPRFATTPSAGDRAD